MNILNRTLKTKVYRNYIKRTLIILKYRHLKTPTGLHLRDSNNYSNVMGYGFLIKKANQYYKYCIISPIKTTLQNGQIKKLSYISIIKDSLIYISLTVVLNYAY